MRRRRRVWTSVVLATVLVLTGFALPYLRSLAWIHLRSDLPEGFVLPLPGLRIADLEPTFGAPRPLGRHEGIDLLAPAGTPVLAAAEGIVIRNRPSQIGGNVVWVMGAGRQLYYYAHLRELAPGLLKGLHVEAGEQLGSVGNTGNARGTPPHLHFAIYRVHSDLFPLRYRAVDPYPLLVASGKSVAAPAEETQPPPPAPPSGLTLPFDPGEASSLTVGELVERAEGSAARLARFLRPLDPFLGIDADGDVRRVQRVYALAPQLRRRAAALRSGAPEEDRPLADLALELRFRGQQLYQQSRRLEGLLDAYESCEPRELGLLLNALETLAQQSSGDSADPVAGRADYFFFAGHLPDVVPEQGGWAVLVGEGLWEGGVPAVSLVGPDEERIASFDPHRSLDGRGIAVHVPPGLFAARSGGCFALRVRRASQDDGTDLFFPMCVPKSYGTSYRLAAYLSYRRPTASRVLETDEILFSNDSCEKPKAVSKSLEWPLRPGGRLVDMGRFELYAVNESAVDCRIEENRVICSGSLGPARCDGEGDRDDTQWHHLFSPTEEYPDTELHRSATLARPVAADSPVTRSCTEIRRDHPSAETSMWFDVFVVNSHQERVLFSSPPEDLSETTVTHYSLGRHRIDAELRPGGESDAASICVTVRSPACALAPGVERL